MRILGLTCLFFLTFLLPACGNVFVGGAWTGGKQTISGVVSIVQLSVSSDGTAQITVVTLAQNFGSTTSTFCGDQRSQFPVSDFVQATFMPGQPCADLFTVVITIH